MMDSDLALGSYNSTGHLSTLDHNTYTGRMHHSASTPAGVDSAGAAMGGSRTPPATPKKGGKMLAVRVQMLDDTISMFQIQSKALGKVLFEQVCRQLHLLEADYFGLEYTDVNATRYWLDVEKPICRQVGLSMLEPTLRFCVKFYTPDPARLEEEFTRYLFCLQVKRDLAQGCIQCNENTAALMASYIVQAECGDFVPEDYPNHSYLSGYKFFPGQDPESERRIMENHKKHVGQSPAEADMNLLETARRCEFYGIKMHPAKDYENVPLNLAVAHMGIVVYQNYTKISTFSWAKIRKISFKRKKFIIKFHPEGYSYSRDTMVEFFFDGRNECKNFWKKCVENHGFFRCTAVSRLPRHRTRVMSRGSSFRYSGRTQKQIVEYVRDNYVKRQTLQKSESFRATRSLRSSRANVSANAPAMNTSVSAHPLLPLPPGSEAISLEWDKQPHYLEASLMMKGYSAAEAREAAARPASRVRPPLQATTYAAIRDRQAEVVTHAEVNHHPMEDSPLPHRTTTSGSPGSTMRRNVWARADSPPLHEPDAETTPEEDSTSSASLAVLRPEDRSSLPNSESAISQLTQRLSCNGVRRSDVNSNSTQAIQVNSESTVNGNSNGNLVAESTNSIDVLSAGESDAGDTLKSRKYNNSISSNITNMGREGSNERSKRRAPSDLLYCIARELLMTERTYKRDLELLTVTWSLRVSALASTAPELVEALGRPCLALEPLALSQGGFLARLEKCFAGTSPGRGDDNEDAEYKKIADLLYDYLSSTCDAYESYTNRAGVLLARIESSRRGTGEVGKRAEEVCAEFEATAPLPLACLLLRPLHRTLYYRHKATELSQAIDSDTSHRIEDILSRMSQSVYDHLRHAENHAALCQLNRDIIGYDRLLVADREFLRLGCVFKHSAKGLQQRIMFLFTDMVMLASKCATGNKFRAHCVLPLHALQLEPADMPHSFALVGDDINFTLSASNEHEFIGWCDWLERAIDDAREAPVRVDTNITVHEQDNAECPTPALSISGGGFTQVCWHRGASFTRDTLHLAMTCQMSGYLLRKFKKSLGWQKLWVCLASAALYFYKSCHDDAPLVSLPLLGYTVSAPTESDAINKEYVFKLQFKNHVYFFRADSQYTCDRWTQSIRDAVNSYPTT